MDVTVDTYHTEVCGRHRVWLCVERHGVLLDPALESNVETMGSGETHQQALGRANRGLLHNLRAMPVADWPTQADRIREIDAMQRPRSEIRQMEMSV